MAEKTAKPIKRAKVEVKEPVAQEAPAPAPAPAFVRYKTVKDFTGRLLILGLRPTMPTIPGPCNYKVPSADVEKFEATREFKGGMVVRVD